jgi:F-type H+-transporting ATPase subunit delta
MKLSKDARKLSRGMFQASFTEGRLDEGKVRNVAQTVVAQKPRQYVDILKAYQRLLRLEVEKHHAVVESASELDQATREQLEQTLRAKYGADLTTDFRATPDLIGGLRIKIGSDVFDSSVRDRLARLESELIRA